VVCPLFLFTNDLGEQQTLFTAKGQQLFRPEMFADTADPQFYRQFVQSGISRPLSEGLIKEMKDSGINLKNGAADLGQFVVDHPGAALEGLWEGVKGLPAGVVDGFKESGHAIGEGAATAFNDDIAAKLNAIYSVDVSTAQQSLLFIRTATAVSGAGAAGKAGAKVTEAVSEAVGKKLDDILKEANERALLAKSDASSGSVTKVDLNLKYKEGWSAEQKAAADVKCQSLCDAPTVVTEVQRSGTSASSRYKAAGNTVPAGHDVDHVVDLQLGGADEVHNMSPLDSSVNRSLGSQIHHQIKDLPPGTVIDKVNIR